IADEAVETNRNQVSRWNNRYWRAAARPSEVENATQRNGEAQYGRNCCQPSPPRGSGGFYAEAKPSRKKPEPQSEERASDRQRGDYSHEVLCSTGGSVFGMRKRHCVSPISEIMHLCEAWQW